MKQNIDLNRKYCALSGAAGLMLFLALPQALCATPRTLTGNLSGKYFDRESIEVTDANVQSGTTVRVESKQRIRITNFTATAGSGFSARQVICRIPDFDPEPWEGINLNHNCYCYANNVMKDLPSGCRAGEASNNVPPDNTLSALVDAAVSDGLLYLGGRDAYNQLCPNGETKIAFMAKSYNSSTDIYSGYHWARRDLNQDGEQYWSHKDVITFQVPRNWDDDGYLIPDLNQTVYHYNRELAQHDEILAYFCSCSDTEQGAGHQVIE